MELIKTRYVAAGLFGLGLAFAPALSGAAVLQASAQLLSVCPDLSSGIGCPQGATIYLASGHRSNQDIVDLVTTIAQASDTPQVPMRICLDAAEGIRVLGGGVSNLDQRQQILLIADEMCRGAATAAIAVNTGAGSGDGNGGNSSNNGTGPVPVVSVDPVVVDPGNGNDNGNGGNGDGDHNGNGDGAGSGNDNGNGGDNGTCAGNSSPGNGNNCDNANQSHAH
jgi:hypothetical protein